jgi:hypothetical protein
VVAVVVVEEVDHPKEINRLYKFKEMLGLWATYQMSLLVIEAKPRHSLKQ